ncbi:MAG: hypothetical protein QM778_21110 [Myxococcales bacterium]
MDLDLVGDADFDLNCDGVRERPSPFSITGALASAATFTAVAYAHAVATASHFTGGDGPF